MTSDGERLYLAYGGQARSELVPVGDNRYLQRESTDERSFNKDADGRLSLQFAPRGGPAQSFPRLDDSQVQPRELLLRGNASALAAYQALQKAEDKAASEGHLNGQGFDLLERGNIQAGVAMLSLNTQLYPAAANTWDSLGYAYLAQGNKVKARVAYRKALAIDPAFASAKAALLKLE